MSVVIVAANTQERDLGSVIQELNNLRSLVERLQRTSDLQTTKIEGLQQTSRDQQAILQTQDVQLRNLKAENQELRDIIFELTASSIQESRINGSNVVTSDFDTTLINKISKGDFKNIVRKENKTELKSRNKRLLSQSTVSPPTKDFVAFYAFMSAGATYTQNNHVLVFDTVKTNFGNSFHHNTGVFIVPTSGLYVFTWTIREHNGSHHSVALVINNEEYGAVYQNSRPGDYDQCSTTVVIYVNQGDDVFLRTRYGTGGTSGDIISNPYGRTSFSGWKIH
ncbi:uncharacterized protein LOC133175705 [Saccostrea echinata]|uniref:uncharacterized protein LOC133175705 n=1 Tax=Saccostrea echinata TaxID=191078 RepID=UPI002A81BC4D|nr:uncharacterized protein LOC133175705 [Saccostrea echinata]